MNIRWVSELPIVLFDEPAPLIEPLLNRQLRRQLKQIHLKRKLTLIHVTHDQVEALTFADQVVVMAKTSSWQVPRSPCRPASRTLLNTWKTARFAN